MRLQEFPFSLGGDIRSPPLAHQGKNVDLFLTRGIGRHLCAQSLLLFT